MLTLISFQGSCIAAKFFNLFFNYLKILVPLLTNEKNHEQWPAVVSQDVRRHVHTLKSNVYVVSGQVNGKTLLPLPVGTEKVGQDMDEGGRYVVH